MKEQFESQTDERIQRAVMELENERLREKYEKKLQSNSSTEKSGRSFTKVYIFLAILGVLLVGGYMLLNNSDESNSEIKNHIAEMDFYTSPGNTVRGSSIDEKGDILLGEKLFNENKIEEGIKVFQKIDPQLLSSRNKMLMAQAYLKLGDHNAANKMIVEIEMDSSNLKQEVQWLKVLNLIQLDRMTEAKPIMREIVDNKQYKWKEIQKIIENQKIDL